ncbi:MAG: hypothetical protein HKN70_03225 [Gammaproteobacteria bacterium]|nr:hypothetical protein [Gammaproteobacteria bacterium]
MVSNNIEPQPDQQSTASPDPQDQHAQGKTWAGKASILLLLLFIAGLATAAIPTNRPVAVSPSVNIYCMSATSPHEFATTAEAHAHEVTGAIMSDDASGGLVENPRRHFVAF